MKQAIKAMGYGNHQSSARVVDGKLILSFPHANTPVVWQMDLTEAKASALEVREKDANHVLVLKTPKGETTEVGAFGSRAQAVEALMAVSRALENAQGQIRPVEGGGETVVYRAAQIEKPKGKWLSIVLAAIMLFILFGVWGSMLPRDQSGGSSISPVTEGQFSGSSANGSPVNADEFLLQNK